MEIGGWVSREIGGWVGTVMAEAAMAKDIALLCEAKNDLLFRPPLFVNFDRSRGDKIDPQNRLTFLKDYLSLFELKVFSM